MSSTVERDIIETATRLWINHRRHEEGRRPPSNGDLGLNLYWNGSSWYASVSRWPARTPRRRIGVYSSSPNSALTRLLDRLRQEG